MRERASSLKSIRPVVAVSLAGLLILGCTSSSDDDSAAATDSTVEAPADSTGADEGTDEPSSEGRAVALLGENGHAAAVTALTALLPADTRGLLSVDVASMSADGSSPDFGSLVAGEADGLLLGEMVEAIGTLAGSLDIPAAMTSAVVAQTTDGSDGMFLVAALQSDDLADFATGSVPSPDGEHGSASTPLYLDDNGTQLALLPGGVLVAGTAAAVGSVIDVSDGESAVDDSAIAPFLDALTADHHLSFVYGLPGLFDEVAPDLTLRGAAVLSGALDVADGAYAGGLEFHTANASAFVETYNTLDRHATRQDDQQVSLGDPLVDGLGQVIVPIPASPIAASDPDAITSRNLFKKLFVGMEAFDYADGVFDPGNDAWADLIVKSEADGDEPLSPASVFFRWEFRDQAAIEAFEANELPEGFTIAPTRFFESDPEEGSYFFLLNLYNAGGGSIVGGARAEFDVYVHGPEGADPNAGERPRFFVVEALAEEVSADPVNLVTTREPVSHVRDGDRVVSTVRKFEGDGIAPVFAAEFPVPDVNEAEVVRFTPEMAIGNDYIYWGYGVSDRVLYNATTYNHDAYLVDPADVATTIDFRWAEYLKPDLQDVVYYVNTLEYVASPLENLDSEYLDITPEWLAELYGFKNNGHQSGIMRKSVEQLFRGENDALVSFNVGNETPSTYYNFEISDPEGMAAAIDLPAGHQLAPTTLIEGGAEAHYLTLSVYEIDGASEGTRAEWSVYTDIGDGRPPKMMVLDLMTEDVGIDPLSIINLPSDVRHSLTDGVLSTRLNSPQIGFNASFDTAGATARPLALNWVEAGDVVCYLDGICDKLYYDAETLDVPVQLPTNVTVESISTPWDDYLTAEPVVVFYRDNAQLYVAKRWHNLDVFVEELPFSGLEGRTHEISGSGTLVGRDSDVADSVYIYTGDAVLDGDQLVFALDQQIDNVLGTGNIFTTGTFDLASGSGTQTVLDCLGPALLCSDVVVGSTAFYTTQGLDASDPDSISWQVDVVLDLGGMFGTADSASTLVATRAD